MLRSPPLGGVLHTCEMKSFSPGALSPRDCPLPRAHPTASQQRGPPLYTTCVVERDERTKLENRRGLRVFSSCILKSPLFLILLIPLLIHHVVYTNIQEMLQLLGLSITITAKILHFFLYVTPLITYDNDDDDDD